ncbi:peptidoglycan DD-metalloendopeptidase family protein [Dyadobacter bucti]|uniref:peptidoglycan DD-metalloendopeptidase family protein n=1 Tax=Dyadobacter bucti TaxID=2572203 RepID=UPI003F71148B
MKRLIRLLAIVMSAIFIYACKPVPVSHWFPVTPLEKYEKELLQAKLETTPAGQTWFRVSKEALTDSLFSPTPYQERFYLGDSVPAQSVRFLVQEGRRLLITPEKSVADTGSRLFVELYKIKTNGKPQRIEYLSDENGTISYAENEGDTLLLRLQTGLGQKLTVAVTFATQPVLDFPVADHGMSSVISFWGVERDGGARSHEGIDIKAKRGTPVVASDNGFITSTGTNNLGGKVVFLSAAGSPYSLYYAHLDSQLVHVGQRVLRGDTLGLVGNTGNAITTIPHLHFGIYSRGTGAVNPLPFINDRKEKIPGLPEQSRWLGDTVAVRKKVNVFATSSFNTTTKITTLPANDKVRVLGEMAKGYRIVLQDGTKGYIPTVPLAETKKDKSVSILSASEQ